MERHPAITIRLSTGAGRYDLLRDEQTDAAILYGDLVATPGLAIEALGEEEIRALCAPDLAAGMAGFGRRAIVSLPLIESSVSPIRWSDWFAANGLGRHPQAPATSFDRAALVVSAAVQGVGVALESERFAAAEIEAGQLVPLGEDRFKSIRRVLHHLVIRTGVQVPHRVRAFRAWLLEEVG